MIVIVIKYLRIKMFSKTRMFYYDNEPSTAIIGTYTDFTIEKPSYSQSYPYLSCKFPSSLHNWSYIPLNAFGLYCTFGEIQSLIENNDSFIPEKIEITVGHTIPLAKYPSTTNSTQLSFNNTIYSLIAVEDENYVGINSYIQDNEVTSLVRTFDGVDVTSTTSGTRSTLPKRDIYFRIPYHTYLTSSTSDATNETLTFPFDATTAGVTPTALNDKQRLEVGQTIKQLIDSYIPELLQNNDKVYTLYPGENQFSKDIDGFNPRYCAIDCSGTSFNEALWHQDQRMNCLINRDYTDRSAENILSLPIAWNLRGNYTDVIPDNLYTTGEAASSATTNALDINKLFEYYYNRDATDDYNIELPKIFIKGLPIVDDSNSLIPHTFHCTITHTIYFKCNPRSNMNVNRLQWRMTYPYLRTAINSSGNVIANYVHQGNFAKKPFRTDKFKKLPFMRFKNLTSAEQTTPSATRAAMKNKFKNAVTTIGKPTDSYPDNIAPSQFGSSLPFAIGWYDGFAFAGNSAIP